MAVLFTGHVSSGLVDGLVDGRAALVSGAGSGIGRAAAALLAAHGARVAVVDLVGPSAEQTAQDIRQSGGAACAFQADAADESDVARVVAAAAEALGGLNVLVNNAGIAGGPRATADELSLERWDEMLRVNFRGYLLMSRAALPWLARDGGVIVNNASSVALSSAPRLGALRHGQSGRGHADAAARGRVGAARSTRERRCAGYHRHRLRRPADQRHVVDSARRARHERYIPLGREGTAADVAGVMLFLCSDLAGYVTGQTILIDGGLLDMVYPMVNDTADHPS